MPKEVGSITGVLIVGGFGDVVCWGWGCRCCSTNQELRKCFSMFWNFHTREVKGEGRLHCDHWIVFFLEPVSGYVVTLGWVLRATSLLPVCWQALATVLKKYRFKLNDIITGRHLSTTVWEPLLTGTAFNYCCFFGFITWAAFAIFCPGIAKYEADHP